MAAGNEAQSWTRQHSTHLPTWRRTSLLLRPPSIKVLSKDNNQLQDSVFSNEGLDIGSQSYVDLPQKVQQLQRSVCFLKKQHLETLQQLHKELERLKKENKDLNFKLVMCKCGQTEVKSTEIKTAEAKLRADRQRKMMQSMSGDENDPGSPNDELRTIFLEEEVRDLKNALASERSKTGRLMRVIEQKLEQKSSEVNSGRSNGKSSTEKGHVRGEGMNPATLQECESIIKRLQGKLDQKSHELTQIKADLRDVLYSHKWTPDAYLMARAYVSDESDREVETKSAKKELPEISDSAAAPKEMVEKAYQRINESLALPALLPKVPITIADRKRKAHTMQKYGTSNQAIKSGDKAGFY